MYILLLIHAFAKRLFKNKINISNNVFFLCQSENVFAKIKLEQHFINITLRDKNYGSLSSSESTCILISDKIL